MRGRAPRLAPALRAFVRVAAATLGFGAPAANAQSLPPYVPLQPEASWRSLETAHFVAHFPALLEPWTRAAVERLESERDAVRRLVGWAPSGKVTVLVADPYNDANGSAYPFLHAPAVFLWPVPPTPRDETGNGRSWSELLTVHEFAHVAHLARPTRNPLRRIANALLPTNIGPIGAKTPRWVWEGYATYAEGALTGGGRPYGVWRPAFLRQWAVEGRLPNYAALDNVGGFAAGSFAYLAGSAYLEWLVAQRGDSSLPALWRRLTARTPRSFDAAFAGVFPGTPAELYARWSAQVTAQAIATEGALRRQGFVEGALVQRLRGATGDPAVSRDGEWVALVVRPAGSSSRIVVWRTGSETRDSARTAAAVHIRDRQRRLDPEDVPAVPYLPPPKRAVATLLARDGRPFRAPRWIDGDRLLVERDEPLRDGTLRPDLWLWDSRRGALRRVTHGAAVRDADPSPDGGRAVATRCVRGWCDLVVVDLASGDVAPLVDGSSDETFARPRWSHDGRRFVVARQREGRWEIVVADRADPSRLRVVGPRDGASRYDPSFLPGDSALVVTSEASGTPNLERVDLVTGAVTGLTRVTGAAFAPEPIGATGALYTLTLRSTGFDLRRVALADSPPRAAESPAAPRVATGDGAEAAARAVTRRVAPPTDTFAITPLAPVRHYGLGPRLASLLPAAAYTADGESVVGVLTTSDPIGRLTTVLLGAAGTPSTWRGGSLSAALRIAPATVDLQLFRAAQRFRAEQFAPAPITVRDDARYAGAVAALATRSLLGSAVVSARLGASAGRLAEVASTPRSLAFLDVGAAATRGRGDVVASLAARGAGSIGTSGDASFRRAILSLDGSLRSTLGVLRGSYLHGAVDRDGFERFVIGGAESALIDASVLSQRIAMPALPIGTLAGRRVDVARVATSYGALEPFAWAARASDVSVAWLRVVGVQRSWLSGPIPFARAPGVRASAGAAYVLDGPNRRRAQLFLTVAPRP